MFVNLAAMFGGGVAAFFAPCVLPLLPVYLSAMTGHVGSPQRWRSVAASVIFVIGLTTTFSLFGALAGRFGSALSGDERPVEIVGGALIAVCGVLQLMSSRWGRTWRPLDGLARRTRNNFFGPAVLGLTFGVAWSPCVGPFLAAALATAGSGQSAARGAIYLVTFSLGLGLPFVFAATGAAPLLAKFKRAGVWVAVGGGAVMVVVGVVVATGNFRGVFAVPNI